MEEVITHTIAVLAGVITVLALLQTDVIRTKQGDIQDLEKNTSQAVKGINAVEQKIDEVEQQQQRNEELIRGAVEEASTPDIKPKDVIKEKDPYFHIQSSKEDVDWGINRVTDIVSVQDVDKCKIIEGTSMVPRLHPNDIVCYDYFKSKEEAKQQIQVGDDVIAARENNTPVTHTVKSFYPSTEIVVLQGVNQRGNKERAFKLSEIKGVKQLTIVGE